MKTNASLVYSLLLVICDFFALVLAFVGAYVLRVSISHEPLPYQIPATTYLTIFLAILPFWILIFALLGLYRSDIYERRFNELGRLFIGSFIGLLFVIFWNFVSLDPIFPAKLVPFYGFILGFFFLVLFRNILRAGRFYLFGHGINITNILIIGNTPISDELVTSLKNSKRSGYQVLGIVGDKRRAHRADYTTFDEALEQIDPRALHGIVQTELYPNETRNHEILEYAQTHHLSYRFVPGNTELFVGNISVELFRSSIPVIAVHQTALLGWGRVIKRVFDLMVTIPLIILMSPVMFVLALLVKLEDNGPVFFRQTRLTRFNREFKVFKFRTLNPAYNGLSPEEGFAKMGRPDLLQTFRANGNFLPKDPRNTRIGNFMRATSLDELPQLFNVLRGDLSLVGPRALVPADLATHEKRHTILSVKSGITGLAQVSGRNHLPIEERRKLDVYYAQNWTFWLDLIILLKTVRVILTKENATPSGK